jgi:Flp pilus assembly protein TadD
MSTTAIRNVTKVTSLRAARVEGAERSGAAPSSGPGFLARAVALHLAGQREEALKQLQRAVAADEASAEIYRAMGHIQFELGNFEESAKSYRTLAQLKPQYAMGWFNLAVSLERNGVWEDASEAFQKASTLETKHVEAHLGLAVCGWKTRSRRWRLSSAAWNYRPITRTRCSARPSPCSRWAIRRKRRRSTCIF